MREEESRLLSWGSFLLLLIMPHLWYALGEGGITIITDGRKISEGVYVSYMMQTKHAQFSCVLISGWMGILVTAITVARVAEASALLLTVQRTNLAQVKGYSFFFLSNYQSNQYLGE